MSIAEKIKENVDLAARTTFRIGGPARYFLEVESKEDLAQAVLWAREQGQRVFVLGGGSNVLIHDQGLDGLVLRISNQNIAVKGERLEAGAGAALGAAMNAATAQALSGLEWAAGIPGTVGGAIRGNAGAYGAKLSDSIETVEYFDMDKGRFAVFSRNDCAFGYRTSLFKIKRSLIVWSAVMKLAKADSARITQSINSYLLKRRQSQPCLPSAGCVFKNLQLSDIEKANPELARAVRAAKVDKNGMVGTGWLINKADLRGRKLGQVKVSLEHANFIVNAGQAQAGEVAKMAEIIKNEVKHRFNIDLQEEIEYMGF
jgi:UDP-N-acetylmuramate dehydrogenase